MSVLILIRGVPGAGKTTMAEMLAKDYGFCHHEADHYMVNGKGEYEFNPSKLSAAHDACYILTMSDLMKGMDVVVSNTFIKKSEINRYLDLGVNPNVEIVVVKLDGGFKSIHDVPAWKIARMRDNYEEV